MLEIKESVCLNIWARYVIIVEYKKPLNNLQAGR